MFSIRGKKINKQEALQAQQEKKRNYENAQTEQMIHQNACRIRVEMAKVDPGNGAAWLPAVQTGFDEIIDGRKRTDES